MKQAFKDRCLEAVADGRGPADLLLREWLPDLARAATESHLDQPAFSSQGRRNLILAFLCLALAGLLLKERFSPLVSDGVRELGQDWHELRYAYSLSRAEREIRGFAARLDTAQAPEDRAVAAYLFGALHSGREVAVDTIDRPYPFGRDFSGAGRMGADGDRATAAVARLLPRSHSGFLLALLARACAPGPTGCNRSEVIRRFVAVDPDNAFAWSLEFTDAHSRGDEARMQRAITAMARASRYETYDAAFRARLFAAAGTDPNLLATTAWAAERADIVLYEDWRGAATLACTPSIQEGPRALHWVDLHPESAADCERIAGLLAASTDLAASSWGWRRLRALAVDAPARDRAERELDLRSWMRAHAGRVPGEGHRWTPWTREQWAQSTQSWAPGDGELPALRRWLQQSGASPEPPPAFAAEHG